MIKKAIRNYSRLKELRQKLKLETYNLTDFLSSENTIKIQEKTVLGTMR